MIRTVLAGWILTVSCVARGACDEPTSSADLEQAHGRFQAAWDDLDDIGVASAVAAADRVVRCLDEPFQTKDIAAYFQIRGLSAFLQGEDALATGEFKAAAEIFPALSLPPAMAHEGDDWHTLYTELQALEHGPRTGLPAPAEGWIAVDGARVDDHPAERPWIFQQFDPDGSVLRTARISARGGLPKYDRQLQIASVPDLDVTRDARSEDKSTTRRSGKTSMILLGSGVGAVALGGLSMGIANGKRKEFIDTEPNTQLSQKLEDDNLAFGALGVGGVLVGTGLGIGAVLVAQW